MTGPDGEGDGGADEASRIVGLYRRHASAWARARGTALPERAWLDRFHGLLPEGAAILDIGCGSGRPVAADLDSRGCRVTGVDCSPEMIALFRDNLPGRRAHVADMRTLRLGLRFDGLLAWDSVFHLAPDDQRAMFPVFAHHAAQRAALMLTSGPRAGVAMGVFEGEPLYHASLDADEYRALLAAHGFEVAAHAVEDPACGGRTVWLARRG